MLSRAQHRLQKELTDIQANFPMFAVQYDDNIMRWLVTFICPEGTVYAGESYTLEFKFDPTYPIDSPDVIFHGPVPDHEHIYSNGYICLSILYDDWTPSLRVSSVVLSILSMMSSA
jgi:ubiquitin-conjugating enzyme E2 W